jgi:hypothetical protein
MNSREDVKARVPIQILNQVFRLVYIPAARNRDIFYF